MVEVLSTPTLLAWMEETACELSLNFHTAEEITVGVRVELGLHAGQSSIEGKGGQKTGFFYRGQGMWENPGEGFAHSLYC